MSEKPKMIGCPGHPPDCSCQRHNCPVPFDDMVVGVRWNCPECDRPWVAVERRDHRGELRIMWTSTAATVRR